MTISVIDYANPRVQETEVCCGCFTTEGNPRLTGGLAIKGKIELTEIEFDCRSGKVRVWLEEHEFRDSEKQEDRIVVTRATNR